MGKGSSSDRARTQTTMGTQLPPPSRQTRRRRRWRRRRLLRRRCGGGGTAAVMRIPPPPSSSQTSSRPGSGRRKFEGGIFRLRVDDRGGGGALETREREKGPPKYRERRGESKKPDAAPSSLSTRGPVFTIFFFSDAPFLFASALPYITLYICIIFFHQADLRSINDNHNKGVVERI